MPDEEVDVAWELAEDEGFEEVVAAGVATATPALAHSVHVDATGLAADAELFYRFTVGEHTSPTGRTRTLPAPDAEPDAFTFGFGSCQRWQDAYWVAYDAAVEDGLDLFVHLGDYIYENEIEGGVRTAEQGEAFTLEEYRDRYALYKADRALRAAHAAFPFAVTWDDHEVDNDHAGSNQEDGDPVEEFDERRAAAYQAWYEHQPVRVPPPDGASIEVYRGFDVGRLARFSLLDTRQHRDDQPCAGPGEEDTTFECGQEQEEDRTMLGAEQESWLDERLVGSPARWNVIAQSVVVTPIPRTFEQPRIFAFDQWDGYAAARRRLVSTIVDEEVANPVVITGDVHLSAVCAITEAPDAPDAPLAVTELVATSISSGGGPNPGDAVREAMWQAVPNVAWVDAARRGYVRVEVTPERLTADYRLVEDATDEASPAESVTWVVADGTPGATRA